VSVRCKLSRCQGTRRGTWRISISGITRAFTTQTGVVVAGVFKALFPFPALFSWNAVLAAKSAAKLRGLNPELLAVGHGPSISSPARQMDVALEEAFRQHPEAR
jgi:hypothetical protein